MRRLYLAPTSLPDTAPLDFIDASAAAGFDGVGLRLEQSPGLPFHPVLGDAALIAEMRRRLAAGRLAVHDIFTFYLQPETDVAAFAPALDLGAGFGARYAVAIGNDPDWNRMRDNFGRFCDLAARAGLTAIIEFVAYRQLATLHDAVRIIAESGRRNTGICIDPLHFARSGGVPADVAAVDRALIPYIQLSDGVLRPGEPDIALARRTGPGERRLPGEGTLPLRELLLALPADLPLSVEIIAPKDYRGTPEQWARGAADVSRRYLAGLAG